MSKKTKDFEKMLRDAMKAAGTYRKSLEPMVVLTASTFRRLAMANADIDALDHCWAESAQGMKVHPACDVADKAEYRAMRLLSELGLSIETIETDGAEGVMELIGKVNEKVKKSPAVLRVPKAKKDGAGEGGGDD